MLHQRIKHAMDVLELFWQASCHLLCQVASLPECNEADDLGNEADDLSWLRLLNLQVRKYQKFGQWVLLVHIDAICLHHADSMPGKITASRILQAAD